MFGGDCFLFPLSGGVLGGVILLFFDVHGSEKRASGSIPYRSGISLV